MVLEIKGSESKVKRLEKELRLRFKRDGLEANLKQAKKIEVKDAEIVKPKAKTSKKK